MTAIAITQSDRPRATVKTRGSKQRRLQLRGPVARPLQVAPPVGKPSAGVPAPRSGSVVRAASSTAPSDLQLTRRGMAVLMVLLSVLCATTAIFLVNFFLSISAERVVASTGIAPVVVSVPR